MKRGDIRHGQDKLREHPYIAQVRTLITDVYFRHVRAFQPALCGLRYRDDYRERGESGWTIKSTT